MALIGLVPNLLYNLERLGAMAPWPPLATPMINSSTLGPKGIELTSLIQNPRINQLESGPVLYLYL